MKQFFYIIMLVQMVPMHVAMYYNPELSLCHRPKVVQTCIDMFGWQLCLSRRRLQHDSWLLRQLDSNLGNKKLLWQHTRGGLGLPYI